MSAALLFTAFVAAACACIEPAHRWPTSASLPATASRPAAGAPLVVMQTGVLPIILSAPHGGTVRVGPDRRSGLTVRDERVDELTERVAVELARELGGRPCVVIARFSRKDADANRAAEEAYESPQGKRCWEAYHAALRPQVDDVRRRFGGGLLIDIHGQKRQPNAVIRGTRNLRTVDSLVRRFGVRAVTGPESLVGGLAAMGYEVVPPVRASRVASDGGGSAAPADADKETLFEGGYIVTAYGSDHADGIDAIQLELGTKLRSPDAITKTAHDLARAIAGFHRAYLTRVSHRISEPRP